MTTIAEDELVIYADGGSRGNPGIAGAGAVLKVGDRVVDTVSELMDHATNNVAEYTALVLGLEKGLKHGYRSVSVFMDSELVVKQMLGQYRVKHEGLIPLFEKARNFARQYRVFTISHVRREHNKEADKLANQAMDRAVRS